MKFNSSPIFNSFRFRLFLSFFSFVIVLLVWAGSYLWLDHKQKQLNDFTLTLNDVQIQYLKSANALDKFILAGYHDPSFYKNEHQADIDRFLSLQSGIASKLFNLKKEAIANHLSVGDNLSQLTQISKSTVSSGTLLRHLYFMKGFVDYGTEGLMRQHAHWIEDYGKIAKVDILQLRRHEKDYIMRGKIIYANEYFGTVDSLIKLRHTKDSTYLELVNYRNKFSGWVNYSRALGMYDKAGVVPDTQNKIADFNKIFVIISSISTLEINHLQNRFTVLLIIITTILAGFIVILSYSLSNYLTTDIKELNKRMEAFINADFSSSESLHVDNSIKPGSMEVEKLFNDFNLLKVTILNYINNISVQSQELQCLNEELQVQSEELTEVNEELMIQKEQEHAANLRYTYATKATSDAIWDWDLTNDTLIWGEGFKIIFGHSATQIQPAFSSLKEYLHPQDAERVLNGLQELINSEKTNWKDEYRYLKADGEYAYVTDRGFVIRNERGRAIRIVGAMHDSSRRKKEELELKLFADDLFTRNKELHQFGYVISHNLRSPIANIMGITSLLELDKEDPDTLDRCTRDLKTAVYGLDSVVKDLSKILSITDGSVELTKEKVDLSVILNNVKTDLNEVIEHSKAKIDIPPDSYFIFSHKAYLYSIFFNLIGNAIKYKSALHPEISIKITPDNGTLVIVVSDNGIGIDIKKYADDLFKPYKRFNANVEGKGLGLFLVKCHVEALKGEIEIQSELGKGSDFIIRLPISPNVSYLNN